MKAAFRPAILASFLLSAACVTGPLTYNDDLVVPGERIGEIEIGMPLASLLALKGTPQRTVPISGTEATSYTFQGLTVGAHDTVYWIIADDARFHTAGGVRPGAEQIFARASLGKPECVVTRDDLTIYDYGNLYFNVDNGTGKVAQVGVQKKTQTCNNS
jgi:hypothetical protein